LVCAEGALKEVESQMGGLENEVAELAQKESRWKEREEDIVRQKSEWKEDKIQLERGCVDTYEKGFIKVMNKLSCSPLIWNQHALVLTRKSSTTTFMDD